MTSRSGAEPPRRAAPDGTPPPAATEVTEAIGSGQTGATSSRSSRSSRILISRGNLFDRTTGSELNHASLRRNDCVATFNVNGKSCRLR